MGEAKLRRVPMTAEERRTLTNKGISVHNIGILRGNESVNEALEMMVSNCTYSGLQAISDCVGENLVEMQEAEIVNVLSNHLMKMRLTSVEQVEWFLRS